MATAEHKKEEHKNEAQSHSASKTMKKGSKSQNMFLIGIIAVIGIAGLGSVAFAYGGVKSGSMNPLVVNIAKVVPFTALEVDGKNILYRDYVDDFNTLKTFYTEPPDGFPPLTDEEISQQVVSRLVVNQLVQKYAKELDVTVDDSRVEEIKTGLISQFATESAAEEELFARYGMGLEDYTKNIIRPLILEEGVQEAFAVSDKPEWKKYAEEEIHARHILFRADVTSSTDEAAADAQAKAKGEEVLARILNGEDFAALAAEFGTDSTASKGGDLGWFGRGVMVQSFEEPAFALAEGSTSQELVKSEFGYHIIRVDEKRNRNNFGAFLEEVVPTLEIKMHIDVPNPFESMGATMDTTTESGN